MRKIIGIGETILDIIFKNEQPTAAVPGGSTFNGIISLGRLGLPTTMITETGNDKIGRVIKDFMIQGGDPDSKGAPAGKMLGTGGPGYTIPAEFAYPQCFHKRGALSAARLGDEVNPEKESSGSQFYIVWGKTYKPQELRQMERQMAMQQEQNVYNQLARQNHERIMELRRNRDREALMALQDQLIAQTKQQCKDMGLPTFTQEQTNAYTTVGGTPFLDGQYTVFGEVEEGLDVVEKIQNTETLRGDRPKNDVTMTVEIINE